MKGDPMHMHSPLVYRYDPRLWHDHEQVVLASGECPLFFPTGFVREPECLCATYECSGFSPLDSYRIERTTDVLYLLEKVLLILHQCRDYFFFPENVTVTGRTVFYRPATSEVKMAYCPSPQPDLIRSICSFLVETKRDVTDVHKSILDEVGIRFLRENLSTADMLTVTGLARRLVDRQTTGV